jgi:hypothetical protein
MQADFGGPQLLLGSQKTFEKRFSVIFEAFLFPHPDICLDRLLSPDLLRVVVHSGRAQWREAQSWS